MGISFSLLAVTVLILIAYSGVKFAGLHFFFGVVIPYIAIATFVIGIIYRVVKWGLSPVPFCIPTTCGQQESLPWIKQDKLENPSKMKDESMVIYSSDTCLLLSALIFHFSFLIIIVSHLKFFTEQVPSLM